MLLSSLKKNYYFINNYYKISKKCIHNQSYIMLNEDYNNLKKQYKKIKIENNNLIDLNLDLKNINNKLFKQNQELKIQLNNKEKFINLHLYSANSYFKKIFNF